MSKNVTFHYSEVEMGEDKWCLSPGDILPCLKFEVIHLAQIYSYVIS